MQENTLKHTKASIKSGMGSIAITAENKVIGRGADVDAAGALNVTGKKGVSILDVQDTTTKNSTRQTITGEISITLENEFVNAGYAAKRIVEASMNLDKLRKSYESYKENVEKQKEKLAALKERVANGEAGLDSSDVEAMQRQLSRLESMDAEYGVSIAAGVLAVAMATKDAAEATRRASQNSIAGGTNIGLELKGKVENEEKKSNSSKSVASIWKGGSVAINAQDGDTLIKGSDVSGNDIVINTQNLNVLSGQSSENHKTTTQSAEITVNIDLAGGVDLDFNAGVSGDKTSQTTHTNSKLLAKNITLMLKKML